MKKLLVGCLCLAALASCNVKNSDEYKTLKAQNDSLMALNSQDEAEMAEMMALINQVEENFNQIKTAEKYLTVESKAKGEMTTDTKAKIQENFNMINDILKKNKEDIATLNKKLSNSKGQMSSLKSTIDRLNKELEDRATTITELQATLATRDQEIAKLNNDVRGLAANVSDLADKNYAQASKIQEQDKALNTAYYMFGTSKELKEAKVISGGFLVSSKLMKESIDKNKFIRIDIRETKEIPVYAKNAKVLSNHPNTSYTLEKDANKNIVLKISDYQKFWSLTPFLVIQVS
ncbi:chromosome segregation ATPase [Dysgonomonas sp. PH5-45]|uniref:Cbp1 family collagen-binding glycoprotein adhesin n=1 Tax=unclassified Dysgonomonas TaxID=2630389 RepID=UPI002473189D|nr:MULTISPECIES: hypothetical protein [unclassified Dysgonomonas]MDH6356030.1 chromosome segregation ATPase [Dysgonomonas sp. PH5-45]MDH6388929.1 chromosome segregation ATPase [Dysgonomonas sp. PH5-37]